MATEFKFPDVGEGIQEGEVVKWLVKEGDSVKEDQKIVQVETDKAVVDIPSPKTGIILKINVLEGKTVKVGESLCTIGTDKEKIAPKKEKLSIKKKEISAAKNAGSVVGQLPEAEEDTETEIKPQSHINKGVQQTQKVLAAPVIRKLASEKNINLNDVTGTGPEGRITMKDLNLDDQPEEVPQQKIEIKKKYDDFGYLERVPLKGIRKSIAENMTRSALIPQVTLTEDINIEKLTKIKNKEKNSLSKKGIKLTLLAFIIKATIASLKEHPILNSSLENNEVIIKKYFNIGVAVETPVGLMVPVIKIAQNKTISEIAKEIVELAEKARSRKLDIMDLKGGTFTITNYGSIGGIYGTPLINPPEAAILGLGRIFNRGGKRFLPISLTFDHRILDGAEAARFVESLKKFIEDPTHLLLDLK